MEQKRQFASLTGLKGLFIWIIVWYHTAPITPLTEAIPLNSFVKLYGGTLGNDMFFLLSGFLMAMGYRDRIREGRVPFAGYLKRRLEKLYPMYLMTNLAALLLTVWQFGMSGINLKRIVFALLLQSGGGLESTHPYNGPAWFVSALFVCYLAYYALTYHAKQATAYRCGLGAAIAWGYTLLAAGWSLPFCHEQNGAAFLNFFLGCALAEVWPYLPKAPRHQLLAFLALGGSGYLLMRYGVEVIAGDSQVAFAFVICPLILYLAAENRLAAGFLNSRPVAWLGNISMAVYFWHFVVYDAYRWIFWKRYPGQEIGEAAYLLYILLMVLWCAFAQRRTKR